MIYLIGSLRNAQIPHIGKALRGAGCDVFDDWWGAGEKADDAWKEYEAIRGRNYADALMGEAATTIFLFDKSHLDRCSCGVLVLPAGKSGHIELGYLVGQGKPTYVLFPEEPERDRWDLMYRFATKVVFSVEELINELK
jgi:hypothetical protein